MKTSANGCAKFLIIGLFSFLSLVLGAQTSADDSSWMEDNLYRFRNNDLTVLSIPASHDAGMYKQDLDRLEVGVENLHANFSMSGPLVPSLSWGFSKTGILEAGELLDLFDELMAVVRAVDTQCINIPGVLQVCTKVGLEDAAWGWLKPYYELATQTPENLSITQNLDLYGQLASGVRRFDLRPKELGGELYIHHSQGGIQDFENNVSIDWSPSIYVPCVGVSGFCVWGTGESYELGTFSFAAGGAVRSVSSTGPSVNEVLDDVQQYMEGHRELVILNFGAYWAGWQGAEFNSGDYDMLIAKIEQRLGPWLLTPDMLPAIDGLSPEERLNAALLPDLIGPEGRVIISLADGPAFAYTQPDRGLWPAGAVSAEGGGYSNSDDVETMREDQRKNWHDSTAERFDLWWTLTCQPGAFDCSVRDLAAVANPELPAFVESLAIPNANGNNINEIWVDFAEETAATRIAIGLNPWAATIDIKPGNTGNTINPRLKGVLWVALLSDKEGLDDPMQIDLASVRFGPGGAKPDRFEVSDLNRDGAADLLLRFWMPDTGLACGDTTVTLVGHTIPGQRFIGFDSIATVGCNPDAKKKR
jgi:hypothetical protein